MSSTPSVAIIIVNWNGRSVTEECLESLKILSYSNYTIFLVDNGSTDGSASYFREQHPDITLLPLDTNTGFTGGNNAGIKQALNDGFDYVLLLNNDTIVDDPDLLSQMIAACEGNGNIGMACPTIYYDEPVGRIWYAGGWLSLWKGWGHHHSIPSDKSVRETGYVTGCCLLAKTATVRDIGMLNEAYFLSVEDVEWSRRAQNHGWKTFYVPSVSLIHKDSLSSKTKGQSGYSPTRIFFETRNSIWFIRTYANGLQKLTAWPLILGFKYLYKTIGYSLLGKWEKLRALSRGIKAGVREPKSMFKHNMND